MLPEFDKQWTAMGFTDKELKSLQEELTAYPKSEKDNLSKEEQNAIKKLIKALEDTLAK